MGLTDGVFDAVIEDVPDFDGVTDGVFDAVIDDVPDFVGVTDGVFVAVIEEVGDGVIDDVGVCVTVGVLVNVALKLYSDDGVSKILEEPEALYVVLTLTELDALAELDSLDENDDT